MANQSGTLTSSQGSTFIGTTPNDTITFTPSAGTYTVEYPLGTVAISASTSTQSLSVSGGQVRVTCASGSVAWAVSDGNDGTPLSQTELLSVRSLVSGAGKWPVTAHGMQIDYTDLARLGLATWTGGTGTLTVTREVTLDGRSTLRVDMPSACTRVELGVIAGMTVPSTWDVGVNRTFGIPFNVVDRSPITTVQLYVGDSTYTAYDLTTLDVNAQEAWNGWHVIRYRDGWPGDFAPTKTGPVSAANVSQGKIRINKSAGTAATLYLSWGGVMPRESARILWTADDGYDEWATWLQPTATLYGIPFALGFDRFYAGTANFMTEAQIRTMAADTSGLFELYPHAYNNLGVSDIGAAAYLVNDDATWAWLQSLGVRNGRNYHPWVKGQHDDTAVAGMAARGVSLARTVLGYTTLGRTYTPALGEAQRALTKLRMPIGLSLESGYTLANGRTAIDTAISTGGTLVIMSHEFVDSGATGLQWTKADAEALMAYAAGRERAGLAVNVKASDLGAQVVAAQ